jgi:hypothetical protein
VVVGCGCSAPLVRCGACVCVLQMAVERRSKGRGWVERWFMMHDRVYDGGGRCLNGATTLALGFHLIRLAYETSLPFHLIRLHRSVAVSG